MNYIIHNFVISPSMLSLISEIDEFKGAWKLLGKLTPERLLALRKVATIESIGSSTRIEGSKLSDREVDALLSNLKTYSFVSRDEQEVAGYAFVCQEVFDSFEGMVFSENLIKQLHAWLLQHSDKDARHRGEYKKLPNHVEAFDEHGKSVGVVFQTATPFQTPLRMEELVVWVQEQLKSKQLHPLLVIGIFIVIFLAIHPFQDGNGRLSRVLTTLLLLQSGYLYVPYSSLESFIEQSKDSYYLALRKTQGTLNSSNQNFEPWLMFFLRMLQKQKVHLEQKMVKENKALTHLPKLATEIITLLCEHGSLSIGEIETMTAGNRNTLKKYLADLVDKKMIVSFGQGKGARYKLA
jgi:Fic family protein